MEPFLLHPLWNDGKEKQEVIHLPYLGRIEIIHDRRFFNVPLESLAGGPLFGDQFLRLFQVLK